MSSCWACSYPSEFSEKYNSAALGDVDFVTLAHRLLLARDPSAEELQSYLHELSSGELSRIAIYKRLLASSDFRTAREPLFTSLTPDQARAELQRVQR